MLDREPVIYDLRDKETLSDIHIDNNGDTVIPVKNGDRVLLSPEVAEEIWSLIEKEHAIDTFKTQVTIETDDALLRNVSWLGREYVATKNALVAPLESFICEMVLREFDLQDREEESDDDFQEDDWYG